MVNGTLRDEITIGSQICIEHQILSEGMMVFSNKKLKYLLIHADKICVLEFNSLRLLSVIPAIFIIAGGQLMG